MAEHQNHPHQVFGQDTQDPLARWSAFPRPENTHGGTPTVLYEQPPTVDYSGGPHTVNYSPELTESQLSSGENNGGYLPFLGSEEARQANAAALQAEQHKEEMRGRAHMTLVVGDLVARNEATLRKMEERAQRGGYVLPLGQQDPTGRPFRVRDLYTLQRRLDNDESGQSSSSTGGKHRLPRS